jgi:hypothetical protein
LTNVVQKSKVIIVERQYIKEGNNMAKARYAIYFTWNDGFEDSFNVDSAKERDMNIKEMVERKDFKEICYSRIFANGEYGKRIKVL